APGSERCGISRMKAELLVDCRCTLGEGLQWNDQLQRLFWTDIQERQLYSCDADGQDVQVMNLPDRLGSFAFDPDGDILAAYAKGLFRMAGNGRRAERLTDFEPDHPTSRLNDGRCDRVGQFITGGIDENGLAPTSSLIRFSIGRTEVLRTGVGCANSICFSPDGSVMYFTDNHTQQIVAYDYEPDGPLPPPRVFHDVPPEDGNADGSCIDAEGAMWNARFYAGNVRQILPDGSAAARVDLPAPNVTCTCFGGPDLDRLYIITARVEMTDGQLAESPHSGSLFVADVGVRGLPEERFATPLYRSWNGDIAF
ncbi:MAG: SMP-30/gluconolactonase/LRE family protein, partial [Pseudomonadota bacterium]